MDWSYIAGFFDGEGSIGNKTCRVSMAQKETLVLEKIKEFLLEKGIRSRIQYYPKCSFLYLSMQEDSLTFLDNVLPMLVVKHQKAVDAFDLIMEKLTNGRHRHYSTRKILYKGIKDMRESGATYQKIKTTLRCSCGTIAKVLNGTLK